MSVFYQLLFVGCALVLNSVLLALTPQQACVNAREHQLCRASDPSGQDFFTGTCNRDMSGALLCKVVPGD